jgi:hypothetical protein
MEGCSLSRFIRVAAVLLRHDNALAPPTIADMTAYLRDDHFSIARFWRDATDDWVTFHRFDLFGWYDVALPPAPSSRSATLETAKQCLRDSGVALANYDRFFAIRFPGDGYDSGAAGSGAAINSFDSHLWAAHEFGHVLGFRHSFGIPTLGGDQDADGIDEPSPTYGDPYCIMSAATFGGADPTVDLRVRFRQPDLPGLPNARISGPPPSRAIVHFQMPLAMEVPGRVRHVYEGVNDTEWHQLYAAGTGGAQLTELVVFHSSGEAPTTGVGRVYVEFRRQDDRSDGTRWDAGLAASGTERDRAGVVIHVVRIPIPPDPVEPSVFYEGRILMPGADLDTTVPTPVGQVRVSVTDVDAHQGDLGAVTVKVAREGGGRSVTLWEKTEETRTVVATEMREAPSRWPFLGPLTGLFIWETREVKRTWRYRPFVTGLGGAGTFEGPSALKIQWTVAEVLLVTPPYALTAQDFALPGGSQVRMTYNINSSTGELSVSNRPSDGPYTVPVLCTASAPNDIGSVSAEAVYSAPAQEEGWGEDYYRFLDWWHDMTHPVELEVPGPPTWWLRERFDRAGLQIEAIERVNPDLAAAMKNVMTEVIRAANQ